jgi:thiol-disulfide isomerase/thioredoxin
MAAIRTPAPAGLHAKSVQLPVEGDMPGLDGATGWLNSAPLTPADLRGKVVLVDFWTFTCVNWLRTLPYLKAWAQKYGGQGLAVIGVHTPEFGFEHDEANVRRAVADLGVTYPVALDSDYAIWRAFSNHYWPALYFADTQGRVRHHHFGEGEYRRSEMVIQQLLAEAGLAGPGASGGGTGSDGDGSEPVSVQPRGAEVAADWETLRSSENYTGYERTENFASPGGAVPGGPHVYAVPPGLHRNHWALAGDWTMGRQGATVNMAGGQIACGFHARDMNLVMGMQAPGANARFRVLVDGQVPGAAHGADVNEAGEGTVREQRLYQLIRQPGTVTDRTFEMTFLDPGAETYSFTFG